MNFTDLFIVTALVSAIYGILVVVTRERQFIIKAVNPHRTAWLIAGLSAFWAGVGMLRLETNTWDLREWGTLLSRLVSDDPLSTRGKAASVAMIAGLLFSGLVGWCYLTLPRDPSTFYRPQDRRRAFQYYISGLQGGLDYGCLAWGDGTVIEENCAHRAVKRMLQHMPRVGAEDGSRHVRTAEEQVQFWRETAQKVFASMPVLDEVIASARLGTNRRLVFDCEYGGLFFIFVRLPEARDPDGECMYLFAATLHQAAMNDRIADAQFSMLLAALRNIENGIKMT